MTARISTSFFVSAAIALGLACSGCSFMFSRGPRTRTSMMEEGGSRRCSTSVAPPVLDTVFTGTHIASASWALTQSDEAFGGSKVVRDVAIGADLVLAAVHLVSAIYGYWASSSCRDARRPEAPLGEGDATEAYGEAP